MIHGAMDRMERIIIMKFLGAFEMGELVHGVKVYRE